MFRTLRSQYLAGSVVIFLAMLGLLVWNAAQLMTDALREQSQAEALTLRPILGAAVGPLLAVRDHATLQDVVRTSASAHALPFIEVIDSRGAMVARVGEATAHLDVQTVPVSIAGQGLGQLRFGLDQRPIEQARARLLRNAMVIAALVAAAGLVLFALANQAMSGGFQRLVQASRRVADGDYDARLPDSRTQELHLVSDAFNRMAAAVRSQMAALRDSQQVLRQSIDTLTEGVIVQATDGRVIDCNEALLSMYGLQREQLVMADTFIYGAHLLWPSGRELLPDERPTARALATGQVQHDTLLQLVRADGRRLWCSVNAAPLYRAGATEPYAALASLTDVTRHVEAEHRLIAVNEQLEDRVDDRTAELRRAVAAAEQANRAKSQFLSRMSHELRTPLNAILGFAQLLSAARSGLAPAALEQVAQIERAGWHLLELINDVLDVSRIEAGEMQATVEPVPVSDVVAQSVQMLDAAAQASQVQVMDRCEGSASWVQADRRRLLQVVSNLLSNAIKYNHTGGTVTIDVQRLADGRVCLSVADTGCGFSPAEIEQVYEPFTRFDRSGQRVHGTGIGLVITKRLVELMGGTLELQSQAGQGSVFRVLLAASAAPGAPPGEPASTAPVGGPPRSVRRVLYIEDNPANSSVVEAAFSLRAGYAIALAPDGETGLAQALASAWAASASRPSCAHSARS